MQVCRSASHITRPFIPLHHPGLPATHSSHLGQQCNLAWFSRHIDKGCLGGCWHFLECQWDRRGVRGDFRKGCKYVRMEALVFVILDKKLKNFILLTQFPTPFPVRVASRIGWLLRSDLTVKWRRGTSIVQHCSFSIRLKLKMKTWKSWKINSVLQISGPFFQKIYEASCTLHGTLSVQNVKSLFLLL